MEPDLDSTRSSSSYVVKATSVPESFFVNRDETKTYFKSFGKIKLVMFKPKRGLIYVEYADEDGMLNILETGGNYNGQVFAVSRDMSDIPRRRGKAKKTVDPDWAPDSEVQEELAAMASFGSKKTYNLRPEAMNVDPQEVEAPKLKIQKRKKVQKKTTISNEETELMQIINQQGITAEDRYKILDARDKLIRLRMKKDLKLPGDKATVGTCPDMCPEKERLMREVQHQVALYEQEEGGKFMNHKLAVKQYSRSSADQEMPLPQELRPVNVLQMTMGYLMHKIMGLCDNPDVNIGEWYHFLWDRTRGIRKDITQQELGCQGSVELVEQCARFHILCSARLVAEDPSVFDQKINTENLTKCLQTLKYMYHDLQLKDVSCSNEAEFRAYIILLNLNDGNFMWEVQHLKKSIQESEEVKFALKVYSSLDKQNYVKFFKLVYSTTFLNACILMRYFIQVRLSALKTFLKSYSPRISQTSLPIQYLSKILGFENEESTTDFFEAYGLYTDDERLRIILDRPSFTLPEYPYTLDRAVNLVESKRHKSIGEVVCGRELPPKLFETHQLQDSFDQFGYLKFAMGTDEVDSKKEPIKMVEDAVMEAPPSPSPPPLEAPRPIQVSISAPPSKPLFVPPSGNIFGQFQWTKPAPTTTIFSGNTPQIKIFEDIQPKPEKKKIDEAKLAEEKRIKEAEERQRKEKEQEEERIRVLREREEEKRREEIRLANLKKQREVEKRLEDERRKNLEIKIGVNTVINGLLDVVERSVRKSKLAEIRRKICERRIRKVLSKWREIVRRKRKRKALDFNPFWLVQNSLGEEADELKMKSQGLALQSIKRYKRGIACDIDLEEQQAITQIDLSELTYKLLRRKSLEVDMKLHTELFWKVTVCFPNEAEFPLGLNYIEKILDGYIKWEKRGNTTILIEQSKTQPTITYCLEKQKGHFKRHKNFTNGFIFIADDFNEKLFKRIMDNFRNYGVYVKVPIVLVLQNYNKDKPHLKRLLQDRIITDYLILVDKFTPKNLMNTMEEALMFLGTRAEKTPPLELDTLSSFLFKYLASNIWKRANSFAKWNSNYKDCLKNPCTVIYLYNEALNRLKKIILDANSKEYASFPDIFKGFLRSEIPDSLPCDFKYFPDFWDHPNYLKHLETILNRLHFPNFVENWPPVNEAELEISISKYCSLLLKEPQKCFYKVMSVILKDLDPNVNFKDVEKVMWSEIIEVMINEKLTMTDFSLYGTGFVKRSIFNQLIVVYNVNRLNDYVRSDWFYVNNPVVKQKVSQLLQKKNNIEKPVSPNKSEVQIDLDELLMKIQKPRLDAVQIKNEVMSCKKMLGDLEETVVIHKRILEQSGHLLKSIMDKK